MMILTESKVNVAFTLPTTARRALLGLHSPDQVQPFLTAGTNVDGV